MNIAVIITVFNRIDKTLKCLDWLFKSLNSYPQINLKVYITDDGSTDGTSSIIKETYKNNNIEILAGSGNLFWNGGMNNSWRKAVSDGGWDGFLWLNNDSYVYADLWQEIIEADIYSRQNFRKGGVYVGSTYNEEKTGLSYGGFNFTNKITLKDEFVIPNGNFQMCECAHGNITYISNDVVNKLGVLYDGYQHGGGDHDYTYVAHKNGFPLIVLRKYVGECENDHPKKLGADFHHMDLKQRIAFLKSPLGFNLNNTLIFQKRCFPYRYPFVLFAGYFRAVFPNLHYKIYSLLRK